MSRKKILIQFKDHQKFSVFSQTGSHFLYACAADLFRANLVPRADVPFGQHQDTELWNNQFPETKILGLPVSQRMRGLVYLESRGEVDVNTFHKDIQYALERLGKSKFGFERTAVIKF